MGSNLKLSKKKEKELIKKFGHIPTKEEIFEHIKASQERMIWALGKAMETAPDDPKIRQQLLEAVEKATTLRDAIYKEVLKEETPPLPKISGKPKNRKDD